MLLFSLPHKPVLVTPILGVLSIIFFKKSEMASYDIDFKNSNKKLLSHLQVVTLFS